MPRGASVWTLPSSLLICAVKCWHSHSADAHRANMNTTETATRLQLGDCFRRCSSKGCLAAACAACR
eukprot:8391731-Alexandrium_andersonii.AAC.1